MARRLEIEIVGDSRNFQRALGQASGSTGRFGTSLRKVGRFAALGLGIAGAAAGAAGVKMIGLASDAAEVDSKFRVIFGKTVPRLTKQINAFAKATGASREELKLQTADLGALLKPIIGNTKETGKMSIAVAKLATDLSSFNNVPVEEALLAIRSGLVGEAEPLRRFGVLLNEAAVQAEAVRLGLVKQGEELTEQQKVQARYSLIMKQTSLAQGDAVRTSGSFANQLKRLKNGVRDAGTSIGKFLLPVAGRIVGAFNDAIPAIQKFLDRFSAAKGFKAKFNVVWTGIREAVGGLIDRIRDALLGSTQRELIKLDSGKIIEWETTRQEGLLKSIEDGLRGMDWAAIGQQVGAGISKSVRITADFIGNVLDTASEFIDKNGDKFAELGAKMLLRIVSKLLDPAFWKDNWKLVLGVAVAVFPIGRVASLGGKVAVALLRPLERLIPAGFARVGVRAVDEIGHQFRRLPIIVQAVARAAVDKLRVFAGYISGQFRTLLAKIPGWIAAAFKIGALLTLINKIEDAIAALGRLKDAILSVPSFIGSSSPGLTPVGKGGGRIGSGQHGGVVPGPRGAPRLLIGHGGETLVPTHLPGRARAQAMMRTAAAPAGQVQVIVVGGDRQAIAWFQQMMGGYARQNGGIAPA